MAPEPVLKVVAPDWEKLPVVVIAPELTTSRVEVPVTVKPPLNGLKPETDKSACKTRGASS